MLKTRKIDLGHIQQKSTTIRQIALDGQPLKIQTSCGCTTAKTKDGNLILTYAAPEFPKYLMVANTFEMPVTKTVTITYKDLSKEIITLTGIIIP